MFELIEMSLLNISWPLAIHASCYRERECSKNPILAGGFVQSVLSGVEGKAATVLMRGAYASYVSANAAKSDKSVSPKAAK